MLTSNIQEVMHPPGYMQPLYQHHNQSEILDRVSTSIEKEIAEEQEIKAQEENVSEYETPKKEGNNEIKLVKYIKIVPRKFKENYELRFRDVVRKGNTLKRELYDQIEDKKLSMLRQKEKSEQLMNNKG